MSEQVVVRLKGEEKDLTDAIKRGEKAQESLTKSIGAFGAKAKQAAQVASEATRKAAAEYEAMNSFVTKAGKNLAGMPKVVRDQFKKMSQEIGVAQSATQKIDATIADLGKNSNLSKAQLERMRQTLLKTADAAEMEKAAKVSKRSANSIVRNIGAISPEMKKIVDAASSDVARIGERGEESVEDMISRLRRLGPEGEKQADAIERHFTQSLDAVENEFKGPLNELRDLGPAGKKAADKIKREMVVSGNVSQAAMAKIVTPLNNLGGKATIVAGKVEKQLSTAADKSGKSWGAFAGKMTGAFGGMLVVSQGVRAVINEVNQALERQAQLRADAKNANRDLATIQAEALPSLAGMSTKTQQDLIDAAPRSIASKTGTGMTGVKELAEAAGVVVSSGVSEPAVIREVMAVSAELNQLNPASISEFSKAVAGALKACGQQGDVRAVRATASAIIAGMKGSGVTSLGQFAVAAPRALAAGALASDGGKFAESIGSFDALAIAGAASQKTGDDKGDRSSTFAAQMVGKLDEFFSAPEISKRFKGQAPGTPLSRLQAIHRLGLQDEFTAAAGSFGDATFKGIIEDLLAGGAVFQDVMRTRSDIMGQQRGPDAGSYAADLIRQQAGIQPTLPMNIARAASEGVSAGELGKLDATGKAASQASLDIVKHAVNATEDSAAETIHLKAMGYRPGLVAGMIGLDGSIERDGFGGNTLQQITRAQSFLQDQQERYFQKRVRTASGADTMGVTAFRTVERPRSELSADELREVEVYSKAIQANERLLGDLGRFDTQELTTAADEVVRTAKRQIVRAQSDGRVSSRERAQIRQTLGTLSEFDQELSSRRGGSSGLDRVEKLLEMIAEATGATANASEVTAANTAGSGKPKPGNAQRTANSLR